MSRPNIANTSPKPKHTSKRNWTIVKMHLFVVLKKYLNLAIRIGSKFRSSWLWNITLKMAGLIWLFLDFYGCLSLAQLCAQHLGQQITQKYIHGSSWWHTKNMAHHYSGIPPCISTEQPLFFQPQGPSLSGHLVPLFQQISSYSGIFFTPKWSKAPYSALFFEQSS
jgi:hypothetical protein